MKFLKTIILFLIIFIVGEWAITTSLDAIISKSSFRFSKLYFSSTKMNNSVLCIGNSRGVNSFYSPYIDNKYSVKSFNLSYNGMEMPTLEIFLEDYLNKHQLPKIVFIEVSCVYDTEPISNYLVFNLYSNKSKKLNEAIKVTEKSTYYTSSIFPLYRYNCELLYRNFYYLRKSDQDWINRYTISKELEADVISMLPYDLEYKNSDLILLQQTVERLKKNDIAVCLFIAPYLPSYLLKINNLNDVIEKIENATGVPVLNISGLLNKPEYFADEFHTNENGAILIADTLMKSNTYNNLYIKSPK